MEQPYPQPPAVLDAPPTPPQLESPSVVFLPGAGGSPAFWRPVADLLPAGWEKSLLSWPGAGEQPHDSRIDCFEDLIGSIEPSIAVGSNLIAQSMGGVIAIGMALRHPSKVSRLILCATTGGIDVQTLGAEDWRQDYVAEFPQAASWVTDQLVDYTPHLAHVTAPTLLLWGDQDPLSPIAVGRRLAAALPNSQLTVLRGGTHNMALEQPENVAQAIIRHLRNGS